MVAAILCREMHWTYQEYSEQPTFFIAILLTMMQSESEERERRSKS